MLSLAADMKRRFCEGFIGKQLPVLFEQQKNGMWSGMTENYMEVRCKSTEALRGRLAEVKLCDYRSDGEYLIGELVD